MSGFFSSGNYFGSYYRYLIIEDGNGSLNLLEKKELNAQTNISNVTWNRTTQELSFSRTYSGYVEVRG